MAQNQLLITVVLGLAFISTVTGLWPKPQKSTFGTQQVIISDPCAIHYVVQNHGADYPPDYVEMIIGIYQRYAFKAGFEQCPRNSKNVRSLKETERGPEMQTGSNDDPDIYFDMRITDWTLQGSTKVSDENYTLTIVNSTYWQLFAPTYFGFVRGLETYAQLITNYQDGWAINNTPISIIDYPSYSYRGIMIDTSRHYLLQETIYDIITTMMFNKLNVLHWHITDDQSFPWQVTAYPDLSNNTKYGPDLIYTKEMMQEIVQFALIRGVRIIPEIDTPGHSLSWIHGALTSNITLQCGTNDGQIDPTMDYTYTVLQNMFKDLNEIFVDEFVHFGGDEVQYSCWDQRPAIKKFMKEHGIDDYAHLQLYFRAQEKAVWKNKINNTKSIMYWNNEAVNQQPSSDDIVQWWGAHKDITSIQSFTNRIVVSSSDLLYLNIGYGAPGINIIPWRTIYEKLTLEFPSFKGTILGPEATLWGEVNSDETSLNKLWMRASVVAEKGWNYHANDGQPNQVDLVTRLVAMSQTHQKRGFQTEPVSTEFCTRNVAACFTNH